jgi:diguanylate cyclase (GGDEF)-like protein/PAS domain S-box-containing protein
MKNSDDRRPVLLAELLKANPKKNALECCYMFFEEDNAALDAAQRTKQSLVDTQAQMGMMLDLMPMGLLIHTRQGIIFANQEASRLLRVSQDEAVGRHFLDFLQTHVTEAGQQMDEAFDGHSEIHAIEAEIRTTDGGVRIIKLIVGALPWDGNPVVQLLLQDVTDLKLIQEELRRLTITDELTGAYNRRHAFSVANTLFNSPAAAGSAFALAVLDIDHFKRINDTYGHASGDIALKLLVRVVREIVAENEYSKATFARVGGEEFLLLIPGLSEMETSGLCERIRSAVEKQPIVSPTATFHMTVSIGVSSRHGDCSFETMFSAADNALYEAKKGGRNRVQWAMTEQDTAHQAKLAS